MARYLPVRKSDSIGCNLIQNSGQPLSPGELSGSIEIRLFSRGREKEGVVQCNVQGILLPKSFRRSLRRQPPVAGGINRISDRTENLSNSKVYSKSNCDVLHNMPVYTCAGFI